MMIDMIPQTATIHDTFTLDKIKIEILAIEERAAVELLVHASPTLDDLLYYYMLDLRE